MQGKKLLDPSSFPVNDSVFRNAIVSLKEKKLYKQLFSY